MISFICLIIKWKSKCIVSQLLCNNIFIFATVYAVILLPYYAIKRAI